jgi:hypothetical protein
LAAVPIVTYLSGSILGAMVDIVAGRLQLSSDCGIGCPWSVGEHGDEAGRGWSCRADRGTSGIEVDQITVGRAAGVGAPRGVVVCRAGIADGEGVDGSAGCGIEVSVTGCESAKLGGGHGVGSLVVVVGLVVGGQLWQSPVATHACWSTAWAYCRTASSSSGSVGLVITLSRVQV